jgi:hypothetical protein
LLTEAFVREWTIDNKNGYDGKNKKQISVDKGKRGTNRGKLNYNQL